MTESANKGSAKHDTKPDNNGNPGQANSRDALLCIDLQVLGCREGFGTFRNNSNPDVDEQSIQYYLDRLNKIVIPNVMRLQSKFREQHLDIIHCRIQSLTQDGRDRSLEHKRLDLHAPPDSELSRFLPEVAPQGDEIIINKTASGVFVSTNIEYVLRNLGVKHLYVTGVYTNECVSSAVRSASDLGFIVTLVHDATAAITKDLHEATLLTTDKRYAKVAGTDEVIKDLEK